MWPNVFQKMIHAPRCARYTTPRIYHNGNLRRIQIKSVPLRTLLVRGSALAIDVEAAMFLYGIKPKDEARLKPGKT